MKLKNLEYSTAQRRVSQLYIVAEALILIGGILAYNSIITTRIVRYVGIVVFIIGFFILICGVALRSSKTYRKLRREATETESLADLKAKFGIKMVAFAFIFIIAIFFGAIYFAYYWTHSWEKVFLFLIAFNLVSDIKDYFTPDDEKEIE